MSKIKISELPASQAIKASSGSILITAGKCTVDNLDIDGNSIVSTTGDINITPTGGSKIVLDGTINIDAGVVTGATSITSTAFVGNLTGNASGTAATVTTAAQPAITSLGTLTVLQVDNINVNGNTMSATTGAINITPEAGSAIVLDGTINVDAGVVTGATSITSTAFAGALTGDVTGNVSGTAATVTTAAQPAITSVGTLTGLTVAVGTGGSTVKQGGSLALDVTPVSNVGTGEDTLITTNIAADTLITTGQYFEFEVNGTHANNANSKVVKVYFGTTVVATLTLATSVAGSWRCATTILRTGTSAQTWVSKVTRTSSSGATAIANTSGSCTETETSIIVMECTGEAVSDADITQTEAKIKSFGG